MDFVEVLGYVAMAVIMIAFLPQAYQVWKTKSVEDISFSTYLLLILSTILWATYGFLRKDNPLIFTNIILAVLQGSILFYKFKYGKNKD